MTAAALMRGTALLAAVLLGLAATASFAGDPASPASPAAPVRSAAPRASPAAKAAAPHPSHPLDLSAPPISHILTPEQVQALIADQDGSEPAEDVTVETTHYEAPVPQGQIRALSWALLHPLEAWRIFTPVPDE